jgi:hypothetical protein
MTNEEMQRVMEFIVAQQAQASSKIDALAETQTRTQEGITALFAIAPNPRTRDRCFGASN